MLEKKSIKDYDIKGDEKDIDFIITEDSDLLAFGTPRVLFKL